MRFLANIPQKRHILFVIKFQHGKVQVDGRIPSLVAHNTANPAVVLFGILVAAVQQIFIVLLILRHDYFWHFVHHVAVPLEEAAFHRLIKDCSAVI